MKFKARPGRQTGKTREGGREGGKVKRLSIVMEYEGTVKGLKGWEDLILHIISGNVDCTRYIS